MLQRLQQIGKQVKRELKVYQGIVKDSRTPLIAKMLLYMAIGYVMLPFDLIPDWIPVIGVLDDLIIVPGLVFLALKMIPEHIVEEHRKTVDSASQNRT